MPESLLAFPNRLILTTVNPTVSRSGVGMEKEKNVKPNFGLALVPGRGNLGITCNTMINSGGRLS